MITTGSKFFFGLAPSAFVAAVVYGSPPATTRSAWTPRSVRSPLGYKGGVGDHLGYTLLMRPSAVCARSSALIAVGLRDADPEARGRSSPALDDGARRSRRPRRSATGRSSAPSASAPSSLGLVIGNVAVHRRRSSALAVTSSSGWCWPGPSGPPATPRSTADPQPAHVPVEIPSAPSWSSPASCSPSPGCCSPSSEVGVVPSSSASCRSSSSASASLIAIAPEAARSRSSPAVLLVGGVARRSPAASSAASPASASIEEHERGARSEGSGRERHAPRIRGHR